MTALGNPHRHHTHRLDLDDPTIREWDATVLLADADQGIVLDRSAFYPGGGGQPPDHGVLLWGNVRTRIVGTRKGDDIYLLPAEGDPLPPAGTSVHGGLDDERRTSLMRTHSGLHVLSAIVLRDFGAPVTGGNMEPLIARMDFDLPDVPADFKQRVEEACNDAVRLDRRSTSGCYRGSRHWRSRTSSAPRATCCRRISRWCGSSTSTASISRPTAVRTWPPRP